MNRKLPGYLVPLLSVLCAMAVGTLFMTVSGRNPVEVYGKMLRATFGSGYGFGQLLFRSTTLVLTALAVAVPYRTRLFNTGGEGQLLMGCFAAAICGTLLPPGLPPLIALPVAILAAMSAGALWALAAGWLRIRYGVNEVISTIMLNFIAQGITAYLLVYRFAVPSTVHTAPVIESARMPSLDAILYPGWHSPANLSLLFAIFLPLLSTWILSRSRFGYEMTTVGLNSAVARHAGINVDAHRLASMITGGAFAGLAASNIVLGYRHWFESGIASGAGFMGIAVALLAGAHPAGILLSALLFAWLDYGGLTVNTLVPRDLFMALQGIVILAIISFTALFRNLSAR